ncbi:MAG: hypothetical protein WEB58_06685 [Planctomycetaceae bacterium]
MMPGCISYSNILTARFTLHGERQDNDFRKDGRYLSWPNVMETRGEPPLFGSHSHLSRQQIVDLNLVEYLKYIGRRDSIIFAHDAAGDIWLFPLSRAQDFSHEHGS